MGLSEIYHATANFFGSEPDRGSETDYSRYGNIAKGVHAISGAAEGIDGLDHRMEKAEADSIRGAIVYSAMITEKNEQTDAYLEYFPLKSHFYLDPPGNGINLTILHPTVKGATCHYHIGSEDGMFTKIDASTSFEQSVRCSKGATLSTSDAYERAVEGLSLFRGPTGSTQMRKVDTNRRKQNPSITNVVMAPETGHCYTITNDDYSEYVVVDADGNGVIDLSTSDTVARSDSAEDTPYGESSNAAFLKSAQELIAQFRKNLPGEVQNRVVDTVYSWGKTPGERNEYAPCIKKDFSMLCDRKTERDPADRKVDFSNLRDIDSDNKADEVKFTTSAGTEVEIRTYQYDSNKTVADWQNETKSCIVNHSRNELGVEIFLKPLDPIFAGGVLMETW